MVDFLDIFLNLLMTLFYWHFARVAYSFYLDLSGQPAQGQSPGEPPQGNVRVRGGFFLVFCCCCLCVCGCVCVCARARVCVSRAPVPLGSAVAAGSCARRLKARGGLGLGRVRIGRVLSAERAATR
jgi:hypothetical protein